MEVDMNIIDELDADRISYYKGFLTNLRDSGKVNMYGAASYLQEAHPELNKEQAMAVLKLWMKEF